MRVSRFHFVGGEGINFLRLGLLSLCDKAIWRGLKSFGARDFSPENSSDEGLKSLAPIKTAARQTPI